MLRARFLALVLVLAPFLSGCVGDEPTVALLLDDASGSSSRTLDVDLFTERVEATCEECVVTVYDAGGDAATQKTQVAQAEASATGVVVVVPVDPGDVGTLTDGELPVVSLGQPVPGADGFVGLEGGEVITQAGTDLEAARDVLLGVEKTMTYVPTRAMSERAADVAVALLADTEVADGEEVDGVQSWLYQGRDVTIDNLTSVLVAQGVITLDDLCGGATEKRCVRLGLR